MDNAHDNYLRFVSLGLKDYKVFGGLNEFQFNKHRTLIVGKGGTGKTIIAEALEHMGPPERRPEVLAMKDRAVSSAVVITEGNSGLINQYRDFIFLNTESARSLATYKEEPRFKAMVSKETWEIILSETQINFKTILAHKPWKIDMHHDFNAEIMAAGERICLGYSFAFAVRKALGLNIPVVFDSPYAMLDEGLRKGLRDFLESQTCQQILLGNESEFSEEKDPKYILVYVENYSKVMEF